MHPRSSALPFTVLRCNDLCEYSTLNVDLLFYVELLTFFVGVADLLDLCVGACTEYLNERVLVCSKALSDTIVLLVYESAHN